MAPIKHLPDSKSRHLAWATVLSWLFHWQATRSVTCLYILCVTNKAGWIWQFLCIVYEVWGSSVRNLSPRHHPIVNDRNHQKADAISVSRIRMHLKSTVLNHKNALFLIPPIQPIDSHHTKLLAWLGKSKCSKVNSQSQVGPYIYILNKPRSNNKKYSSNISHSQCFNEST